MARSKKKIDFEKNLGSLEAIVQQLEAGQLSLEESLNAFEQGVALTRDCQAALTEAQQRVQILTQKNGDPELLDFTPNTDAT